jgi:mannitol 2-dehydrogenase
VSEVTPETAAPLAVASRGFPEGPDARPGRERPGALRLNEQNLRRLRSRVAVPAYRRDQLTSGVVHLGVGNFHRAHQAVYFDDLANLGLTRWGITGIGFRSRKLREALPSQDLLYTVVERGVEGSRGRIVGALRRYVFAPERPARALAVLSAPGTRLVTLTLTGDGYPYDPMTGGLRLDEDLRRDLADPDRPTTPFGYLVQSLDQRRRTGGRGLTVLSCDNRADSAAAARACVLAMAELRDPGLARWVEDHVSFPDSMVDRITPVTEDAHRRLVADQLGITDRWPVVTEPFSQWVIEDAFARSRPPLDQVGAQFVSDVAPYKRVKTRLLNGTHCALGYLGTLAGFADTGGAMADPLLRSFVAALMSEEVAPLLPSRGVLDLVNYQQRVLERLANPLLVDPLSRLAGRASTKAPAYLLPSLLDAAEAGRPHQLIALAVAAWLRCLRGSDLEGRPIVLADARSAELGELALRGQDDPRPLLGLTEVFGDLGRHREVVATLRRLLTSLDELGWRATLAATLPRERVESPFCPKAGFPATTPPAEVNGLAAS